MKTCTKCDIEKPPSEFAKDKAFRGGTRTDCRACKAERRRIWGLTHKEHLYLATNRTAAKNGVYEPVSLTVDQWKALREAHNGLCDLPFCSNIGDCMDHDHITGKFRGFLCRPHNAALGILKTTQAILEKLLCTATRLPAKLSVSWYGIMP